MARPHTRALTACAMLGLAAVSAQLPADYRKTYTQQATLLWAHLLGGDYNKQIPPRSTRTVDPRADGLSGVGNYSQAGADISVQVRIFKLETVSITNGFMRVQIWLRHWWNDERLAWNPADFGNITELYMNGPNVEEPHIWLPEIRVYNTRGKTADMYDDVYATVNSAGNVFWSRPGVLEVLCKFSGLVAFPYDNLKCEFELGGWSLSGGHQGLFFRLGSDGVPVPYTVATSEKTAGSSYQEYDIESVNASLDTFFYDCCENAPWPVARYSLTLSRSSSFYRDTVILPGILLTVASFGVFFMSFEVGERLSYGITLILAVQVMQGTTSVFVPVANELLWVEFFNLTNLFFCYLALYETIMVLFFGFFSASHLAPSFLRSRKLEILCRRQITQHASPLQACANSLHSFTCYLIELCHMIPAHLFTASHCLGLCSKWFGQFEVTPEVERLSSEKQLSIASEIIREHLNRSKKSHLFPGSLNPRESFSEKDAERIIYFEKLFFFVDSDSNGFIANRHAAQLFSFLAVDMTLEEATAKIALVSDGEFIGHLAFMQLCIQCLWTVPLHILKLAADNYIESSGNTKDRNREYWMVVSKQIDHISRFLFPVSYAFMMFLLFSLDMSDKYGEAYLPMFEGFGQTAISASSTWKIVLIPVLGVSLLCVWFKRHSINKALANAPLVVFCESQIHLLHACEALRTSATREFRFYFARIASSQHRGRAPLAGKFSLESSKRGYATPVPEPATRSASNLRNARTSAICTATSSTAWNGSQDDHLAHDEVDSDTATRKKDNSPETGGSFVNACATIEAVMPPARESLSDPREMEQGNAPSANQIKLRSPLNSQKSAQWI